MSSVASLDTNRLSDDHHHRFWGKHRKLEGQTGKRLKVATVAFC